jgi:septation ring formation regulator EzrA
MVKIIIGLFILVAVFVVGILFARKNSKTVNTVVDSTKSVVANVEKTTTEIVDQVKKV